MSEGRIITVQCPVCTQVFHVDPLDLEPGTPWVCEPCAAKPDLTPVVIYMPGRASEIAKHRRALSIIGHLSVPEAQRICDGIGGTPAHVVVEITTTYRIVPAP